jgi:hypothetical protein
MVDWHHNGPEYWAMVYIMDIPWMDMGNKVWIDEYMMFKLFLRNNKLAAMLSECK